MALKEVYARPMPFRGITESKYPPINCSRCTELTVRLTSNQLYCQPCGVEVKLEQTRKSHSTPEARQRNRERNRERRRLERIKKGLKSPDRKKVITFRSRTKPVSIEPTKAARDLESRMSHYPETEHIELVWKDPSLKKRFPVGFSTGDKTKSSPHFHIRQGSAEYAFDAQTAGENYIYKNVLDALEFTFGRLKK